MRERTDVCGRFAPSPSGRMHLGNVFCAVLAWLSARSRGGRFLLRIEDLDVRRCKPEHARLLEEDLAWLGLDWDEGGRRGGPDGPYFQSECSELYAQALQMLKEHARVYPCFCSRADLHAASAPHLSDGAVLYGGRCARLSPAEADALRRRRAPALRIAVPEESVSFTDGHLGHFSQNLARECGDFILRRSDGIYAYQLAVAVDDARMGVTQVVRGQDLLSSTPRQIFLQRLLGLPTPEYYHLPLLVNAEGVRLSKREKSLDMGALRARFTPAELTGWLAFLAGQQPAPEPVPLRSLAACFSWEKVPRRDITVPARLLNEARAEYRRLKYAKQRPWLCRGCKCICAKGGADMFPDRKTALQELAKAEELNPGPWGQHSRNVAHAAELIAGRCDKMDSDKAFVCGLLHDIGRRTGVAAVRHIIDGYDYAAARGWDEVARICLTHSFPVKDIEADIGKKDISAAQYAFIRDFLNGLDYDDYDKLIILCDALADASGFCILEKRFIDTTRRYGIYPFSIDRWNKTYQYKEYFEALIGNSIYTLLPHIEDCIYR